MSQEVVLVHVRILPQLELSLQNDLVLYFNFKVPGVSHLHPLLQGVEVNLEGFHEQVDLFRRLALANGGVALDDIEVERFPS